MKAAVLIAPLSAAVLLVAGAPTARAVDVTRDYLSHGVANCQAALPVFDGTIRKRPKALANEGTTTAFITCDFENLANPLNRITSVAIFVKNRGTGQATVDCTLVQGFGDNVSGSNLTKSAALAPNGTFSLVWAAADYAGDNLDVPATSCALPPGTEIYGTQLKYLEDVGS